MPEPPPQPLDRSAIACLTRAEVAAFLATNESQIRELARAKLGAADGALDSADTFSSVARRLDQLAAGKGVRPRSEAEMWALVRAVTSNTTIEKTRLLARAKAVSSTESTYGQEFIRRLENCRTDDEATLLVHRIALSLSVNQDRQVLFLHLRGATFAAMAAALGSTEVAMRKRWSRMRASLEERLAHGEFAD